MTLRLTGDTSGFTEIKAADAAGDNSIKLPAANGSANQLLQNGGTAGELQYTSAGGGLHYDSNGDLMLGATSFDGFAGGDRRFLINGATNARQEFGVGGSQIGGLYADANRIVVYTSSADHLSLQTNSTERVQITSTGALALMAGCPGIDFSAIQPAAAAGTMTSETLDSYEEGTWTPVLGGSTTAGVYETTLAVGFYRKIGDTVFYRFRLQPADTLTRGGVGNAHITGLPFAVKPGAGSYVNNIGSADQAYMYRIALPREHGLWSPSPGSSHMLLVTHDNSVGGGINQTIGSINLFTASGTSRIVGGGGFYLAA